MGQSLQVIYQIIFSLPYRLGYTVTSSTKAANAATTIIKKCENSQEQSWDLRLSQWQIDEYGWPSKYNGLNCATYFCNLADNKQIHPHWLKPIFMTIWWLQLMPSWPTTHRSAASHLTQSAAVKTSLLECSSIFLYICIKFWNLSPFIYVWEEEIWGTKC
jgi:hypothetical protein